ncbi:MAG: hypothetical protein HDR21_10090 [Lachnospiraceae bacterium]|nr:hypothetical protein [Lachnospiraceae bacterium]
MIFKEMLIKQSDCLFPRAMSQADALASIWRMPRESNTPQLAAGYLIQNTGAENILHRYFSVLGKYKRVKQDSGCFGKIRVGSFL